MKPALGQKNERRNFKAKTAVSNANRRGCRFVAFTRAATRGSKFHAERHLNLPRATNGLVYVAQPEGTIVKAAGLVRRPARRRQRRRSVGRKPVKELVLSDGVDGYVKAWRVGQVENIETKLQGRAFRQPGHFNQRYVHALLPGLPENIALPGGERSLVRIIGGNRAIQRARLQNRNCEARRLERWTVHSNFSGKRRLRSTARGEGHDGICYSV
jgi:hypothetical protein